MKHTYAITVQEAAPTVTPLTFSVEMHEDLLEILGRAQEKNLFPEEQTKAFVLGLKLFSGVMLANRSNPLFADLQPHFGAFMQKLKQQK